MARILLVDDDPGLLQMVRLMLERTGHQVTVAESGEAALAAAFGQTPDLALLDVMMPGMSGYDVTRALRADPRTESLPIVILTARGQPMDRQMAMNAGATSFLAKPILARDLIQHVNDVLAGAATSASSQPMSAPRSAAPALEESPADEPAYAPESFPVLPVITVIGLHAGVGATTLSVNLAMLLRERGEKVCLVDLSATGGQVAPQLHLSFRASWADLLNAGERPEPRTIGNALTTHPPTGVAVLAAPTNPINRSLSQDVAVHVLSVLATGFQRIVVDIGTLNSATVGALLVSSAIVVVIGGEGTSVNSVGPLMNSLQGLGVELGRVRVAVNRINIDAGTPGNAIMKAIGRPLSADVPFDANQPQALQYGKPLVVATPDAPYTQALKQLLRTL